MLTGGAESKALSNAITKLANLIKEKNIVEPREYINHLNIIKQECDKGLNYKVLAGMFLN